MYLVGIAGGSGSGKTTFARKILNHLGARESVLLHMDSYYLAKPTKLHVTEQGRPNFDHPEAFDWELLMKHLSQLRAGKAIACPVYDFKRSQRDLTRVESLGPGTIILFEGIFALFNKEIRDLLDMKCFLHVDADIRFTRRLHRDVHERGRSLESVIAQYYETVRPMYQKFLDPQRQFADLIVGEENDNAAQIVASHLKRAYRKMKATTSESTGSIHPSVTHFEGSSLVLDI